MIRDTSEYHALGLERVTSLDPADLTVQRSPTGSYMLLDLLRQSKAQHVKYTHGARDMRTARALPLAVRTGDMPTAPILYTV
jgi:hypothetical protein